MKDSLDKMIEDQIDDPQITVLGVLIEGELNWAMLYIWYWLKL